MIYFNGLVCNLQEFIFVLFFILQFLYQKSLFYPLSDCFNNFCGFFIKKHLIFFCYGNFKKFSTFSTFSTCGKLIFQFFLFFQKFEFSTFSTFQHVFHNLSTFFDFRNFILKITLLFFV